MTAVKHVRIRMPPEQIYAIWWNGDNFDEIIRAIINNPPSLHDTNLLFGPFPTAIVVSSFCDEPSTQFYSVCAKRWIIFDDRGFRECYTDIGFHNAYEVINEGST